MNRGERESYRCGRSGRYGSADAAKEHVIAEWGWQGSVQQLGAWTDSAPERPAQLQQDHLDSE